MENLNIKEIVINKIISWAELTVEMLPNIILAIAVIILFWFLSKIAKAFSKKIFAKTNFNKGLEQLFTDIIKITVLCLGFVIALNILKLDKAVFSMLAGVGVIGIALGFAFRDLAANFISGLTNTITAPFVIGDLIEVDGIIGTVISMHLRNTLIKNSDGQDVLIPNKAFMSNNLINYSSNRKRRISIDFGIDYDDNIETVSSEVIKSILEIDGVLSNPAPAVNFSVFNDSTINLTVNFWITYPGTDFTATKNEAAIRLRRLAQSGLFDMPFPIRTMIQASDKTKKSKQNETSPN